MVHSQTLLPSSRSQFLFPSPPTPLRPLPPSLSQTIRAPPPRSTHSLPSRVIGPCRVKASLRCPILHQVQTRPAEIPVAFPSPPSLFFVPMQSRTRRAPSPLLSKPKPLSRPQRLRRKSSRLVVYSPFSYSDPQLHPKSAQRNLQSSFALSSSVTITPLVTSGRTSQNLSPSSI